MPFRRRSIPVRELAEAWPLPILQRLDPNDAWEVNTYRACDIRCAYCITTAQGRSTPRFPREEVRPQLERELEGVGKIKRLGVGSFCDVYPSPEHELGITRAALEVLAERDLQFNLVTKGPTIVRDADLLARPGVVAQISLNTVDPEVVGRWEPGAASPDERLRALHALRDAGVKVNLQISPWIPGISDIPAILNRVDPDITVITTPLRLPPYLHRAARAYRLTQVEVNEAFHREHDRVGPRPGMRWSRPPALDGSPPRIEDNFGHEVITDWTPALRAPNPGRPLLHPTS